MIEDVNFGKLSSDVFDEAQKHVYNLMKNDSFKKWQRTPEFKEAVKVAIKEKKNTLSLHLADLTKE